MARSQGIFEIVLFVCHIIASLLLHFTSSNPIGFSLKLIPRDSPDSPLYPGNLTQDERIQRMVEFSQARVLNNHIAAMDPDNIRLTIHSIEYYHAIELSLGTPKSTQMLLMDTGGLLTWTQCRPCINCFNQTYPIFTSTSSRSYRKLPCQHQICRQFYQCVNNECVYLTTYSGGSGTSGVVSMETFRVPFNDGTTRPLQNVIFGCSRDSRGVSFARTRSISGLLGMSSYPQSFISQLGNSVNRRFSYCLPYAYQPMTANSVLRFGEDVIFRDPSSVRRTPFVHQNVSLHYYLNLLDISVAGNRLGFPPGTFDLRQNVGGCSIDSGSTLSYIDRGPYEVVMSAFERHFRRFGLQRFHSPIDELDLCYKHKVNFYQYAGMTFHFQRTDFYVEPTYMYVHNFNARYFCVALMPISGKTLLGAWQQQNTRFVYDLNRQELQFAYEDCSMDRV